MYNHVFNLVIYTIVYMYTCISYLVTVNLVYTVPDYIKFTYYDENYTLIR